MSLIDTDLTKIEIPFGELDQIVQWALIGAFNHGQELQQRCHVSDFYDIKSPSFSATMIYRLKPKPITKTWRMGVSAFEHLKPIVSQDHLIGEGWVAGDMTVEMVGGKAVRLTWEADQ